MTDTKPNGHDMVTADAIALVLGDLLGRERLLQCAYGMSPREARGVMAEAWRRWRAER